MLESNDEVTEPVLGEGTEELMLEASQTVEQQKGVVTKSSSLGFCPRTQANYIPYRCGERLLVPVKPVEIESQRL